MSGDREIRLLIISPDFPPARGGIQVLVHRLASGMSGVRSEVVTLDSPGAADFDSDTPLVIRRAPGSARLGPARNVGLNALALRAAAQMRPDVTLSAHIVASPAAAAIRALSGAPTVQYFYAKEIGGRPKLAAFAARRAAANVSISSYTTALLRDLGVSPANVSLIAPGVDLPEDASPQPCERPTVLTIARLADRYKGHDVMLGALELVRREVPDVEWVVIGDGPLRGELEGQARARGLAAHVRFLGAVSDDERNGWLRRADLLAMPSRLPGGRLAGEGFGIVYLEAAAFGKPVVAGNVAGAVDAVLDGETGLLVDPSDEVAVAGAIARLLGDPQLARRMGAAGAARAQDFAWPQVAERVRRLIGEVVAPRPA